MSKGTFDIAALCLLGVALNVVLYGILKAVGILSRVYLRTALGRKLVLLIIAIGSLFITATLAPKLMPFPITVFTMLGLATVYGFHLASENAADERARVPAPVPQPTASVELPTPRTPARTVNVELPTGHTVTLPLDGMTEYEIRLGGASPVRIDRDGKPRLSPMLPQQTGPEVPRKTAWQHINEEEDDE